MSVIKIWRCLVLSGASGSGTKMELFVAQIEERREIREGIGQKSRIAARRARKPLEPYPDQDSDTTRRGQRGECLRDVSIFERGGDGLSEVSKLREFPLAQLRRRGDDTVSTLLERTVAFKPRHDREEGREQRRHGRKTRRHLRYGVDERCFHGGFSVEQHLALVREMTEVGALCHAGEGGYLRSRGPVESALGVQVKCRDLKPATHALPTACHGPELIAAGHTVTGLARSDAAAARLEALGASALRGSLQDLDRLKAGAEGSDGVIHMAFSADRADPGARARHDVAAIDALGGALKGSDRPLVITSGTLVMPTGRISAETDAPDPDSVAAHRIPGERAALTFAERGVRASIVRLAPTVHGPGDYGFVPALVEGARNTGVSAYIGDGGTRWPAVHRLDAASLYRLAIENAPAGTALHGAAEGGVTLKSIADQIGQQLGVPSVPLTFEQASAHFASTFLAAMLAADAPVSSDLTRALLRWEPTHYTLLEDLRYGDYITPAPSEP